LGKAKLIKGEYEGYIGGGGHIAISTLNTPFDSNGITYLLRCPAGGTLMARPFMKDSCWFTATKNSPNSGLLSNRGGYASFDVESTMSLDLKIDDGLASTGTLLGTNQSNSTSCIGVDAYNGGTLTGDYVITDKIGCIPKFEFRP
jgi:hypothetical protein